jgi:DNA topoisomerase-1
MAAALEELALDPIEAARSAGLRYVTDAMPGIRRVKRADGFVYLDSRGQEVADPDERLRIKALAIPPAWTDVWICPNPRGHLQATGRDARGRKQYRYHAEWRKVRDEAKFERLAAFGEALPAIRRKTEQDLKLPGLPREKVLAALIELLEATLIRVGNDEYARQNDSYGLTTLQNEHAQVNGDELRFHFKGKSNKEHVIGLRDRRLAAVVKQCRHLPGQRLFQYQGEDGEYHSVYSDDVNDYLHDVAGEEFTAKDFRTWAATVLAAQALSNVGPYESKAEAKRNVTRAIETVAEQLRNTPAICRKSYVHPAVIDAYLQGTLPQAPDEEAVLKLLREHPLT